MAAEAGKRKMLEARESENMKTQNSNLTHVRQTTGSELKVSDNTMMPAQTQILISDSTVIQKTQSALLVSDTTFVPSPDMQTRKLIERFM